MCAASVMSRFFPGPCQVALSTPAPGVSAAPGGEVSVLILRNAVTLAPVCSQVTAGQKQVFQDGVVTAGNSAPEDPGASTKDLERKEL